MAVRSITFIVAIFFLAGNARSGILTKTIRFESPDIIRTGAGVFLEIDGCRNIGLPGDPAMPVYPARFILPQGETVSSVSIEPLDVITIDGPLHIKHMQPQLPLDRTIDVYTGENPSVYQSSSPHPASNGILAAEEVLAGMHVAFVNIYPCRLIPATGTVTFSPSVVVTIETNPVQGLSKQPSPRLISRAMRRIGHQLENPETAYGYLLRETGFKEKEGEPGIYPYIIITSQGLAPHFQPLADLQTYMGLRSKIFDLDWISSNYPGGDIQEKIRNFIIFAYENMLTEYVLLGGDDEIIPHRGLYVKVGSEFEFDIPSDFYFAALDGNWNEDGDSYFGEPGEADLLPEITVGRVPVDSADEIDNFTQKLSNYCLSPPESQTTKSLMVGELLWSIDSVDTWGGDYKDEILFGSTNYGFTSEGFPTEFNNSVLYDRDLGSQWNKIHILPLLNGGVNLVNHVGHSAVHNVMRFTTADINLLENTGEDTLAFICYSQGCYTASYDNRDADGVVHEEDAIGEELVTGPAGAVAFIGNTRLGWDSPGSTCGVSQLFDRQFFDAIFGEGIHSIGAALDDSRIDNIPYISYAAVRYVMYEMCLLGDPAMYIWTGQPAELSVLCDSILGIGQDAFSVEIHDAGGPVEGARVSLSCQDQNLCCTGFTDDRGIILMEPEVSETVKLLLSVHAPNHYLFTDSIEADNTMSALPTLAYFGLDDDSLGASSGDGDGIIENGEMVELDFIIGNSGNAAAEEAEIALTCSNPFVSVINDTRYLGNLSPRAHIICDNAFTIELDEQTPDGQCIELEFKITALEGCWDTRQALVVNAPGITLESCTVTDTLHGNGNGCLEAWEFLHVHTTWQNNGSIDVLSPTLKLSVPDGSWARTIKGSTHSSVITAGGSVTFEDPIEFFIKEFTPPFSEITLFLTLQGENFPSHVETVTVAACGYELDDPVDTEDLWDHKSITGADGWHTSDQRFYSPPLSWKCGDTSESSYANMMDVVLISPPFCLHENSTLTFRHWMNAEAGEAYPYWAQDAAVVEISTDRGTTWEIISPAGNYPNRASASNTIFLDPYQRCYSGQIEWELEEFDLSSYNGPAVIRFHFASDEQYGFEGWYIDDIIISTEMVTDVEEDETPPSELVNNLKPAYPNPFNPVTVIPFHVARMSHVEVKIFDVSGRHIRTLFDGMKEKGSYRIVWDGRDGRNRSLGSGVYFCKLKIGIYSATERLVLIR